MPCRHPPLPRLWLMTDERMGDALLPTLTALPKGAGVIFRQYATSAPARQRLFDQVKKIAKRRRLLLVCAGKKLKGARRAHGRKRGAFSAPAHSVRERIAAERVGVSLVFISPVFPTRSHPGAADLGRVRLGLIARNAAIPIIALGGLTAKRARSLAGFGIYGWAAIDGLTRNASPKPKFERIKT